MRASLKSPSYVADPIARDCLSGVIEAIEQLTGARGKKIAPLPADATEAQRTAKINEIIARLQG